MILNYSDLCSIRQKNHDKVIGLFKGTFDLIHHDHIRIMQEIKKKCEILVVEIKTDEDVRNKKGSNRPIINQQERAYIVDNIKCVDYTIIGNRKEKTSSMIDLISKNEYNVAHIEKFYRDGYLIEMLKPNIVFTSSEKPVPQIIIDWCKKLDINIMILPMQNGMHTTDIIEKCKKT